MVDSIVKQPHFLVKGSCFNFIFTVEVPPNLRNVSSNYFAKKMFFKQIFVYRKPGTRRRAHVTQFCDKF